MLGPMPRAPLIRLLCSHSLRFLQE
uniref:Uncharacterized protein n=1 Tax=Anguilla anguilla TaxID=7936 RepID=A0A0E9PCD3_ANGAN